MQGWGLHVWADVRSETEWQQPLPLQGYAPAGFPACSVASAIDVAAVPCDRLCPASNVRELLFLDQGCREWLLLHGGSCAGPEEGQLPPLGGPSGAPG